MKCIDINWAREENCIWKPTPRVSTATIDIGKRFRVANRTKFQQFFSFTFRWTFILQNINFHYESFFALFLVPHCARWHHCMLQCVSRFNFVQTHFVVTNLFVQQFFCFLFYINPSVSWFDRKLPRARSELWWCIDVKFMRQKLFPLRF